MYDPHRIRLHGSQLQLAIFVAIYCHCLLFGELTPKSQLPSGFCNWVVIGLVVHTSLQYTKHRRSMTNLRKVV